MLSAELNKKEVLGVEIWSEESIEQLGRWSVMLVYDFMCAFSLPYSQSVHHP